MDAGMPCLEASTLTVAALPCGLLHLGGALATKGSLSVSRKFEFGAAFQQKVASDGDWVHSLVSDVYRLLVANLWDGKV